MPHVTAKKPDNAIIEGLSPILMPVMTLLPFSSADPIRIPVKISIVTPHRRAGLPIKRLRVLVRPVISLSVCGFVQVPIE